jgi:hypothetical protein
MLRRIADLVFAICLASWLMLGLLLCMTVVSQGWGGIGPKLIHVAGSTNNLGVQSVNLVVWRLAGLLAITVGAGYFWWSQRKHR